MAQGFTKLVEKLPASTPFVGPETLERKRGKPFRARIGANESAFGISQKALIAMQEAAEKGECSWYGDPENYELRSVLAEKHGVHMDEICVDAGIDALLGITARILINPGDHVITSDGAYPTFNYHVAGFGGNLIKVPYHYGHEDLNGLLQAAEANPSSLIYLSNPDNPMGTWHTASRVQQMIDNLPSQSTLLLDEAYAEFANDPTTPIIDTSNLNVLRYRTFSKAYGLAGMRIGYVIAHKSVITAFNKVRNHFATTRLSQIAALASACDEQFLIQVKEQVLLGRERIYQFARNHELPYLTSATNFVAVDMGSEETAKYILDELNQRGIFLRMPGVAPLNQYIRVGIGNLSEHKAFVSAFNKVQESLASA